jgi:hypothetical protein
MIRPMMLVAALATDAPWRPVGVFAGDARTGAAAEDEEQCISHQ